jgi:hypothetical protein
MTELEGVERLELAAAIVRAYLSTDRDGLVVLLKQDEASAALISLALTFLDAYLELRFPGHEAGNDEIYMRFLNGFTVTLLRFEMEQ